MRIAEIPTLKNAEIPTLESGNCRLGGDDYQQKPSGRNLSSLPARLLAGKASPSWDSSWREIGRQRRGEEDEVRAGG